MAGLEEELSLDVSPALQAIDQVAQALQQAVTDFSTALATALADLQGTAVPVDADTAPLEAAVTAAEDAVPPVDVPVAADTSEAETAIQALDQSVPEVDVPVVADTSEAQASIDDLGTSATEATGAPGGGGVLGMEGAVTGLEAALGAAEGSGKGFTSMLGGMGGAMAGVAVGGAAFAAFLGETVTLAADAEAQHKRFIDTLGAEAEAVSKIDVNGLNISLEELGKVTGTPMANLEATVTRIAQLGQTSGASAETVKDTADKLLALGSTFSVTNPRLGDAADVTDRLTNAFARGGRALAPFGVALSSAEINAEALKETGKSAASDLTLFEKATAGANLALQKYPDLAKKFADGTQNAAVQIRALKTSLEETLVTVGLPLLQPVIATFQALIPIAQLLAQVLGGVGAVILPFVSALAPALAVAAAPMQAVADGLNAIGQGLALIPQPVLMGVALGLGAIAVATGALDGVLAGLMAALGAVAPEIYIFVGAIAAVGVIFDAFTGTASTTEQVTKDLGTALFDQVSSVEDLSKAVADLNKNMTAFDTSTSGLKKDAPAVNDALQRTGETTQQLNAGIQGTATQFDALSASLAGAAPDLDRFGVTQRELTESAGLWYHTQTLIPPQFRQQAQVYRDTVLQLQSLRDAYAANVTKQLEQLRVTGQITTPQYNAWVKAATDGTIGWTTALQQATTAAEQHQAAVDKATASTAANTQKIAQAQEAYAAGKITADQFKQRLTDIGISADGAKTRTDEFTKSIDNFRQTVQGALPTAAQSLTTFNQNIDTAMNQLEQDTKSHTGNIHADWQVLIAAQDPQRFTESLLRSVQQVQGFWVALKKIFEQGNTDLAAFLAQQGPQAAGALAQGYASDATKARLANGVVVGLGGVNQGFTNWATANLGVLQAQGSVVGGVYVSGVGQGISQTAPTIGAKAKAGVDAATPQVKVSAAGHGQDVGGAFVGGVGQAMPGVQGAVGLSGPAFTRAAQAQEATWQAAINAGDTVGGYFVIGVAQGIANADTGPVTSALQGMLTFAASKVPHASPYPKVAYDFGVSVVEGIASGITDNHAVVTDALGATLSTAAVASASVTPGVANGGIGTQVNIVTHVTGTVDPQSAAQIGDAVGAGVVRQLVRRNVVQQVRAN